jgi:hypothetical protein
MSGRRYSIIFNALFLILKEEAQQFRDPGKIKALPHRGQGGDTDGTQTRERDIRDVAQ